MRNGPAAWTAERAVVDAIVDRDVQEILDDAPQGGVEGPTDPRAIADELLKSDDLQRVVQTAVQWMDSAGKRVAAGDLAPLGIWVTSLVLLADVIASSNQADEVRWLVGRLTDARQRLQTWNLPGARAWIELGISLLAQKHDLRAAAVYVKFAHASASAVVPGGNDLQPPQPGDLARQLTEVGRSLYYDARDFAAAAEMTSLATALNEDRIAYFVLGNSLLQSQRLGEAEKVWRHYTTSWPEQPIGYTNLALAVRDSNPKEALDLLAKAIGMAPQRSINYLNRAVLRYESDPDLAIADLREAARWASADQVKDADDPEPEAVVGNVLNLLRGLPGGDRAAAGILEMLKASPVAGWRAAGHVLAGSAALAAGDLETALREADLAVELEGSGRSLRIRIRLAANDLASAADDLRYVGHRHREPDEVVRLLDPVIAANPEDALARKWRGYAHQQRLRAIASKADFEVALKTLTDDSELRFWDAMADLTFIPTDMEGADPLNQAIDVPKTVAALSRVGVAASRMDDPEPARVYRWFVDRLGLDEYLLGMFAVGGDAEGGWFTVSPNAEKAYARFHGAGLLNRERRWAEAAPLLDEAAAIFAAEGYPCLECLMALRAADSWLRAYDLEKARARLNVAGLIHERRGQPLNDFPAAERQIAESDRRTVNFELEFLPIYGIGVTENELTLMMVKADLERRLGVLEEATKALGDLDQLVKSAREVDTRGISAFRILFTAFAILREARQFEDAEKLGKAAEEFAKDDYDRATLDNGRGLMLLMQGENAEAEAAIRRALALFPAGAASVPARLTLAQALNDQGRAEEALQIVEDVADEDLPTLNERTGKRYLSAVLYEKVGRSTDAARELTQLLSMIENERAQLDLRDRMAWQDRYEDIFHLAAVMAITRGENVNAFDYVERSRGRALLDEIESEATLTPEIAQLLDRRARLETRALALDALLRAGTAPGDYDLARIAAKNAEDRQALLPVDGGPVDAAAAGKMREDVRLSSIEIERRIAEADRGQTFREGAPLHYGDVRAILAGAEAEGGKPVVLVNYFLDENGSGAVFFGRAGAEEPQVVPLRARPDDVATEARAWTLELRDGKDVEMPEVLRDLIAPIAGHVREGEVVWIVPDARFVNAPLHAGKVEGRLLIERNPVVYTPTVSIVRACREIPRRPLRKGVIVADPLGDLEFAREEGLTIASRLGSEPLVGAAATRLRTIERIARTAPVELLHFATHSAFNLKNPMASGMRLAPEPGSLATEDTLAAEDVRRIDFNANLTVLSGCETGRSRVHPGAEMMGLTRGLLIAGTRSLVVSLWNVADISTTLLMSRFYDRVLAERPMSYAEAMQAAQNEIRSLTIGDVMDDLRARMADPVVAVDLERSTLLGSALAWMQNMAGQRTEALTLADSLATRSAQADSAAARARLRKRVGDVARAIRQTEPAGDLHFRPFRQPYYWAPFIVLGSWN